MPECGPIRSPNLRSATARPLGVGCRCAVVNWHASVYLPMLTGMGDVFKALADPTRRTILDELTQRNGQTLFEICARLATKHQLASSRQAISQHLDVLEAAGLIQTRREGRYKFHHINTEPLAHIMGRWPRPDPPEAT
jgi:DNA-binding transcriptional ArsR family regulator